MLSVAFLTPSLSREAGGIFEVERHLAQHLALMPEVRVEVYGAADPGLSADEALWPPLSVQSFPYRGPSQFRWSPPLRRAFVNSQSDVAHLHALWMHTSIVMGAWNRRTRRPYVTTIHGMLDAWALQNSRVKKRICAALYERRCLQRAACLHAISESEVAAIRAFGLKNPLCLIPNGVVLPNTNELISCESHSPDGKKTLLYLGRIHPKKGLPSLLRAWGALRRKGFAPLGDWSLEIAGWDQGGHEEELKRMAAELGIDGDLRFAGPRFGSEKTESFRSAAAFVLPSLSEGLPVVVLEAWSHSKPVLMTPQCNLPEGFKSHAAIEAEATVEGLTEGLAQIMSATDADREAMGRNGLALVQRKFTWPSVAEEMRRVYQWVVGGGPPPSCVVQN